MYFLSPLSVAQAELQLRLALTTPRKAPLERSKGNTQHLLVSTQDCYNKDHFKEAAVDRYVNDCLYQIELPY